MLDQSDFDDAAKALAAGLVGGHLDLREPVGDHLRGGDAPRRWRVGGGGLHPAGRHRRFARRHRGRLIRHDTDREDEDMPGLIRGVARTAVVAGTATAVSNRVSRRQANRWSQQQEPQSTSSNRSTTSRHRRSTPSRLRLPRPRGTGSDRAADEAGRAQGPGHPHRRRVPGAEGEDPRLVAATVADAVPVPAPPDVDAVRPAARPHPAGRLQPSAAGAVRVDPPGRAGGAGGGTRPVGRLKELGELHRSGVLTDAEFESAKAKLLAR